MSAQAPRRVGGRYEGERGAEHFVPVPDVERRARQLESRRAVGDRDGVGGAGRLAHFLLELEDLFTHRQPTGLEGTLDGLHLLGVEACVE